MKIIQQIEPQKSFFDKAFESQPVISEATEGELDYLRRLEGIRRGQEQRIASLKATIAAKHNALAVEELTEARVISEPLLPNPSEKLLSQRASGEAFKIPSPLHLLMTLCPEMKPHLWQSETLLQLSGVLDLSQRNVITRPDPENPLMLCMPAANGSGKDQIIIAAFAVWKAMEGMYNRVILTSSSHDQVKGQSEPYIKELCSRANKMFGPTFDSIQFYHKCRQTGSEIKMFATDDPKHAEGYHPWPGGDMAIIINEIKSVQEQILEALHRCTGYSYWLEISSPGTRQGSFYQSSLDAVRYPAPIQLGRYYLRHITAYDCPHIPRSHIEREKANRTEAWFKSSILAEFSDLESSAIIPVTLFESCLGLPHTGDDIGIGSDFAASAQGDENVTYVRQGSKIIESICFREPDTTVTANLLDYKLSAYKENPYIWNGDDGGIGRAIIDMLRQKGWRIQRRLNQSAAHNKQEFLNLGAELYFKVKRHFEKKQLPAPDGDPILKRQLTSRYYELLGAGKYKLESKDTARPRNKESPDRADAYVLCMHSFKPPVKGDVRPVEARLSMEEFGRRLEWGHLDKRPSLQTTDRFLMHHAMNI